MNELIMNKATKLTTLLVTSVSLVFTALIIIPLNILLWVMLLKHIQADTTIWIVFWSYTILQILLSTISQIMINTAKKLEIEED
jgi:phosphoglycerol transferase MdoB-like AlkP superfamily enzyme